MPLEGRPLQRWLEDPGWRGKVGFIGTPVGFSSTPGDFLSIAPEGIATCHTFPYMKNFEVRAKNLSEAVKKLEECADALAEIGSDIIAQIGTPFSFASEGGLIFTQKLHAELERKTRTTVVMQGLSVINAIKSQGYKSVAVACTYYDDELTAKYTDFLEQAGIKVLAMQNWTTQGLFSSQRNLEELSSMYPMSYTYQAAKLVAREAPRADCIVVSGGGVRTADLVEPLEYDLQKPVIASNEALFWDIFNNLGIHEPIRGRGSLLATL